MPLVWYRIVIGLIAAGMIVVIILSPKQAAEWVTGGATAALAVYAAAQMHDARERERRLALAKLTVPLRLYIRSLEAAIGSIPSITPTNPHPGYTIRQSAIALADVKAVNAQERRLGIILAQGTVAGGAVAQLADKTFGYFYEAFDRIQTILTGGQGHLIVYQSVPMTQLLSDAKDSLEKSEAAATSLEGVLRRHFHV